MEWTWVLGKSPQLASPKLTIWIGFSSSHGCSQMVRFVNHAANFLLTFNYQSGSEWADRTVTIVPCVSPRNCGHFFSFLCFLFLFFSPSWPLNAVVKSDFAKAYPDTVDATFRNHWWIVFPVNLMFILSYHQGIMVHSKLHRSACQCGYQYSSHSCMLICHLHDTIGVGFITPFFS